MGRYGNADSCQTVLGVLPSDPVAGLGFVSGIFLVVDDTSIHDIPYILLAGKNVSSPFSIRLGSDRELWRLTLYPEKKIVCMDEVVWKENFAFVRLG